MNSIKNISYQGWLFVASFFLLSAKGIHYFFYPRNFLSIDILNSQALSIILCFSAILLFFLKNKGAKVLAYACLIVLFLDNCHSFYSSNYKPQQFIEHSLMMFTPLLFYMSRKENIHRNFMLYLKLTLALTFIGHGIFAVSWNNIPENFKAMTHFILSLDFFGIKIFLFLMGLLDFVAALFIFTKCGQKTSLIYMIVWGFLTSLARFIYGFEADLFEGVLGTLYRVPHFIVPYFIYLNYFSNKASHSSSLA